MEQEQIRLKLKETEFEISISEIILEKLNQITPIGLYNVGVEDYEDIVNKNFNMFNAGKVINRLFAVSPEQLRISTDKYLEVLKKANEIVKLYNEKYNELITKEVVQLPKSKSKFHK